MNRVSIHQIAQTHDTSVKMIEQHYARFISHHNEDALRAMVFDTGAGAPVPIKIAA